MSKLHLTMTGVYAGTTFCGVPTTMRTEGDRFEHLSLEQQGIERQVSDPKICADCLAEHLAVEAELAQERKTALRKYIEREWDVSALLHDAKMGIEDTAHEFVNTVRECGKQLRVEEVIAYLRDLMAFDCDEAQFSSFRKRLSNLGCAEIFTADSKPYTIEHYRAGGVAYQEGTDEDGAHWLYPIQEPMAITV